MSHTKYHTDALILSGVDTGEADRFIQMLTRDFGLLGVHARGVRKASSKQRPYLQNLFFSKVSLVRGRNIWRLVHVEESKDSVATNRTPSERVIASRVGRILRRFIQGEEFNPALFDSIKYGLLHLRKEGIADQDVHTVENLIVLRILFYLGYVSQDEIDSTLLENTASYSESSLGRALQNRQLIDSIIYQAMEESGL
jgi:DNA repair protein RecO